MLLLHVRTESQAIHRVDITMLGFWMAFDVLGYCSKQVLEWSPHAVLFQ